MKALSIEMVNFRQFERFECKFDPNFTLLMGQNGTGKTNLLQAMAIALSAPFHQIGLREVMLEEGDVRRDRSIDPANENWRAQIFPASCAISVRLYNDPLTVAQERIPIGARPFRIGQKPFDEHGRQTLVRRANDWFELNNAATIPLLARYGDTSALDVSAGDPIKKLFETKKDIWQRLVVDQVSAGDLAQWFRFYELRTLQEGSAPLIYRVARQAVLKAIHVIDVKYVVRDNELMLLHEDQGWRPFSQLSAGQRRIAAIFCDLALRCASLNSHRGEDCIVQTSGIVTIDELDLHLHPAWQREVVGDLRRVFPALQFIVTSHSPFLLQAAFEHGKVIDMRDGRFVEPGDTSIEDIAETVMGVPQPQRGQRFLELKQRAQEFYELLENQPVDAAAKAEAQQHLDAAMAVFANDPASAAWLEQRRLVAGL